MTRTDIINMLIDKYGLQTYLEIGVKDGENFNKINIPLKESVDPKPISPCTYVMTSDAFFANVVGEKKYDIIFVDGLHTADQAYKDIHNAMNHLSDNGFIIVHDCNPATRFDARVYADFVADSSGSWNGDVYRAMIRVKLELKDWSCFVVSDDQGCGIITPRPLLKNKYLSCDASFISWHYFHNNRKELLQLISSAELETLLMGDVNIPVPKTDTVPLNLLIKIYIPNLNIYDVLDIVDEFKARTGSPEHTQIVIASASRQKYLEDYDCHFYQGSNVPALINDGLADYEWDIVLPIYKPITPIMNFDLRIRKIYEKNYPDCNGVLWIADNEQKTVCTIPVIGRKYYNEFGYVFSPNYTYKNFDKEFTEVMKIKRAYFYVTETLFKEKPAVFDDDSIYKFREKYRFGLLDPEGNVVAPVVPEIVPVPKVIQSTTRTASPQVVQTGGNPLVKPKSEPVVPPQPKTTVRFRKKYFNK